MKPYNILEAGDIIQEGDEMKSSSSHPWNTWLTENYIGEIYDEGFAPMRRPIPPPQWQTGEIPEPTGPSVCVLETKSGKACIAKTSGNYISWDTVFTFRPNETLLFDNGQLFTGRWYIQQIQLPS
jgi:hypothetical protein